MNWVSDRLNDNDDYFEERRTFRVWALIQIDRAASGIHSLAYPGSDEEIELALDACIPAEHLSERQRAAVLDAFSNPVAHCNSCCWCGFIHQAADYRCPSCGDDSIYWDDRSRAWVPYRDHRALAIRPVCTSQLSIGGAS